MSTTNYTSIPRGVRIKLILDTLNEYSSCDHENTIIETCNKLKKKHCDDIAIIHTSVNFDLVFNDKNTEKDHDKLFEEMYGAYYDDNYKIQQDLTCNLIDKFTQKKKLIFCWTDFIDYAAYRENDDSINELFTHSTLTIMSPLSSGQYYVYQFNPHGRCQMDYKGYKKYISRKRMKYYDCGKMLDVYAIEKYVGAMNRCLDCYTSNKTRLIYNGTKSHNYFGANLQSGDDYGCCYLFPFIIFNDICKYYRLSHVFKRKNGSLQRVRSYKSMIKECKFEKCIYIMLCKYLSLDMRDNIMKFYNKNDDDYEKLEDEFEMYLYKKGSRYIKIIAYNSLKVINNN